MGCEVTGVANARALEQVCQKYMVAGLVLNCTKNVNNLNMLTVIGDLAVRRRVLVVSKENDKQTI